MTGQELLDYLRVDVLRDNALPYLWSDDLILRMLSEAESQFARKTYALASNTPTITTVVGTSTYAVPTGSLYVFSAAISTSARDLSNYTRKVIPSNLASASGTPQLFVNDESSRTIRLYPVPDAVVTVNLRTARLPAAAITLYTSPEIPEEYHLDLAEYVAWRLLQSNDADGSSTNASDRHRVDWLNRLSDAKREYYRFRMGSNPTAVQSWTFRRNGS